jgi:hypothetical protein
MKIMNFLQPSFTPGNKPGKPDPDFGRDENGGMGDSVKLGAAAGWVGLTTAAGAYLGHQRQLADTVTVERIPYAETRQVPIGTRTEHGCYQYHYGYDFSKSEFGYHYGYDSSCTQQVTDYRTEPTGNTLIREVHHHSKGFPNTLAQGALLGLGVGVVTGAAGLVLARLIADH